MTQQNLISFNPSQQDLSEIKKAIATLNTKLLPLLKNLKGDDKNQLPKMGDKTLAFVEKALEHSSLNPELAPPFLDMDEFRCDVNAVAKLRSLHGHINQISASLSDSMAIAGSDAYSAALMFYNSVKYAQKANVVKAGSILDDLSSRFPAKKSPKKQSS